MIGEPYPDEAPSSSLLRSAIRGRLDYELFQAAHDQDIALSDTLIAQLAKAGATGFELAALQSRGLARRWPRAAAIDLSGGGGEPLGKVCVDCLSEDVAAGRDHYIRRSWRFTWRISCFRHRTPLVDVDFGELAPVEVDGERSWRIRLRRAVDQVNDPWLTRAGARVHPARLSATALCLEADIDTALRGEPLSDLWSLGADWAVARRTLLQLTDILISPGRPGPGRVMHLISSGGWVPQTRTLYFTEGGLRSFGSIWQQRLIGVCAHVLIDPERYEHLMEGVRHNPHAELLYGTVGQRRAHSALGQLASRDLLSQLLFHANDGMIERLTENLDELAKPFVARLRSAAAIALYLP